MSMQDVGRADAGGQLPSTEYQNLVRKVSAAARGQRVAETVFPVRQLEGGDNVIGWQQDRTLELKKRGASHPGPIVSTELGRVEGTIGFEPVDVELLFVFDGFYIGPEIVAASNMAGLNLNNRAAQTIGLEVQEKTEAILFKGVDAPVAVTGFDEGATDGGASAGAWSTRANAITDVTSLLELVRNTGAYTGARFMILTGALMTDLMVLENDYTDRVLLETLSRLCPLGIFEVTKAFMSATETALMGCPSPGSIEADLPNFEIVRAAPVTTWLATDEYGRGVQGLIFTKMSPKIHQGASLGEIDNITA